MFSRWRIGFHRHGNCWSIFRFGRQEYFRGKMIEYSWWRFYVIYDVTLA